MAARSAIAKVAIQKITQNPKTPTVQNQGNPHTTTEASTKDN